MRDCSDPHIVQFYGAFLEDVSSIPILDQDSNEQTEPLMLACAGLAE